LKEKSKRAFDLEARLINFNDLIGKMTEKLIQCTESRILYKQLMRSVSSAALNYGEAQVAQSNADLLHKMSISYKEARETRYWIMLLKETSYLKDDNAISLLNDVDELCRIIGKIQITTKEKIKT